MRKLYHNASPHACNVALRQAQGDTSRSPRINQTCPRYRRIYATSGGKPHYGTSGADKVQRGFIIAAILLLLIWAFGFGRTVGTCGADPGVILSYILWGTKIVFIVTLPVTVGAFALGYFVRFKLSWSRLLVGVLVLMAVSVGLGFALANPGFCSPSL